MKNIPKLTSIYLLILVLCTASSAMAASFSADMVITENGNHTISKFSLQDNQYRMDVKEDGMTLTILVNRENKKTRVIDPSQKTYLEFNNDDMRSLMKNPFEAYLYMVKKYNVTALGREIVNTITCDKQEIEQNGKVVMTAWVSSKHNFPIKILNNLNGYLTELKGVRDVPLNPNFFKVPPEFVKQEPPKPQPVKPKKKIIITGKEIFKAPIGRRVGSGGVLSVTVNPKKHISLILRNENQGESSAIIHTLKNNNPVTVKSMGNKTIEFKKIWDKKEISFEKPSNPDLLEVEVTKGMVYVIVNQESPMWEKEQSHENFLKEPTEFGFLTRPKLKIHCQLTGDSQDKPESKLKVTFFKDKYKTPVLSEEISLKNGQSRQWEFDADHNILSGEVSVEKGGVQFRLYQYSKKAVPKKPTVKTGPKPTYTPKAKALTPKTSGDVAAPSGADEQTASSGTILNGEVPLYKGARVIKTKSYGANSMAELQVDATPQELVDFYKQAMSAKGWKTSMAMVQGNVGILQLKKNGGQLVFKVKGRGQTSNASIALMGQ